MSDTPGLTAVDPVRLARRRARRWLLASMPLAAAQIALRAFADPNGILIPLFNGPLLTAIVVCLLMSADARGWATGYEAGARR